MVSARNNILLWPCDDLRYFIINNIAIPHHPAEGRFILTSIRIAVWQYVPINIVELMIRILRKVWRYQRSNQKSLITLHLISMFSLISRNAITSFFYNPSRDKNLPILESVEANQIWFWNVPTVWHFCFWWVRVVRLFYSTVFFVLFVIVLCLIYQVSLDCPFLIALRFSQTFICFIHNFFL
jgi:hypothetical protein